MSSVDYNQALAAYEAQDDEATKKFVEKVIARAPESPEGLSMRLLRARAYEFGGYPGGIDLQKAYADYKELSRLACDDEPEALVGAARVLFSIDGHRNSEEIKRLCCMAIDIEANVHAMMILGLLFENVEVNGKDARKWYMAAYKRGLPWGLRFFANSHAKDGHVARALFAGVLAFITSPLLVLFHGARGPFSEQPFMSNGKASKTGVQNRE